MLGVMNHIDTFRALSYVFANRMVRVARWIFLLAALVLLAGIVALAHYFSNWWLLLLIPYIIVLIICLVIFVIVRVVMKRLYPHKLTSAQTRSLSAFDDKVIDVFKERAVPPWMLATTVVKDLVVHHEITTLRGVIDDSVSLKNNFAQLENDLNNGSGVS